ncbi:MAG TPA: DUF6318 family protein [Jiangellaceae bacterium]
MIIPVARFALLLSVVVVAACSGDAGEPSALPDIAGASSTSTHTPTESPAVESPVEPDNAHEYSAEGVEAFTLYAIEVINYAYQTNDVSYLKQIMSPDCQTCANVVNTLENLARDGGRIEGGQLIPELISVTGPTQGVRTSAGIDLVLTASRSYNSNGDVTNSAEDREVQYIFDYQREDDRWMLDGVRRGVERSS